MEAETHELKDEEDKPYCNTHKSQRMWSGSEPAQRRGEGAKKRDMLMFRTFWDIFFLPFFRLAPIPLECGRC